MRLLLSGVELRIGLITKGRWLLKLDSAKYSQLLARDAPSAPITVARLTSLGCALPKGSRPSVDLTLYAIMHVLS